MLNQFKDFHSFEQLYNIGFLCIPNKKGLYIVRKPKEINIVFSSNTTAIKEFNGRSMLYSADMLLAKFERSDKEILYIGKAGGNSNRLRQRISQFVKYGYCLVKNHRGGRAIWQIANNKTLLLGFMECNDPEKNEKELLKKYLLKYGVLPLANWR